MYLSDGEIQNLGTAIIEPFNSKHIQPASYDLTLHPDILVPIPGYQVDLRHDDPADFLSRITVQDAYILRPGECILGCTREKITVPDDLVARVEGKSSLARLFLISHTAAGWIDSGFSGQVTLELVNHGPWEIVLYPGMKISQISFAKLNQPSIRPYGSSELGSHYQGQMGPNAAKGKRGTP